MKALITLRETGDSTPAYIAADVSDISIIWDAMKHIANNRSHTICYDAFIEELVEHNAYMSLVDNEAHATYDYYINVSWEGTYAIYAVRKRHDDNVICSRKLIIKNDGNCIDRFIECAIRPSAAGIERLIGSISSRMPTRAAARQYHQTACYEKDFSDIIKMRDAAKKIAEQCDKQLERISEFYTKLYDELD